MFIPCYIDRAIAVLHALCSFDSTEISMLRVKSFSQYGVLFNYKGENYFRYTKIHVTVIIYLCNKNNPDAGLLVVVHVCLLMAKP